MSADEAKEVRCQVPILEERVRFPSSALFDAPVVKWEDAALQKLNHRFDSDQRLPAITAL